MIQHLKVPIIRAEKDEVFFFCVANLMVVLRKGLLILSDVKSDKQDLSRVLAMQRKMDDQG